MVSTRARLRRLERLKTKHEFNPYVVTYVADEGLEDAKRNTLKGLPESFGWCFILVPESLSEDKWAVKHSPAQSCVT